MKPRDHRPYIALLYRDLHHLSPLSVGGWQIHFCNSFPITR